jgi:hypothetical protein
MFSRGRLAVCASIFSFALLAGCGSADATGGDSDNITSAKPGAGLKKGAVCEPDGKDAPCASGLACVDNCPKGAKCIVSIFTCQEAPKPTVTVIGANGICEPGNEHERCDDGLACVDNCPEGAKCFVSIFTCQARQNPIQKGGVCNVTPGDKCADGLTCRDNCPKDAKCFVSIFTCQP